MASMPPLPYSGNIPQASISASSLRLQSELNYRSRSNSFATTGSHPTASGLRSASPVSHNFPSSSLAKGDLTNPGLGLGVPLGVGGTMPAFPTADEMYSLGGPSSLNGHRGGLVPAGGNPVGLPRPSFSELYGGRVVPGEAYAQTNPGQGYRHQQADSGSAASIAGGGSNGGGSTQMIYRNGAAPGMNSGPSGNFSARPLMLSNIASTSDLPTLHSLQSHSTHRPNTSSTSFVAPPHPNPNGHTSNTSTPPSNSDLEASFQPSTNSVHIWQELTASKDSGDTLDLSRKGIDYIDAGDVKILKNGVGRHQKGVWRLALSYNRLTEGSFDSAFIMLGRLRYLNLKGNQLKTLPPALTAMPSLEILDVSKNDIVFLPEDPGRLVQLRVLSLSANKLKMLPGYLAYFANLRVLKVEGNPIAWPPPEIIGISHIASGDQGPPTTQGHGRGNGSSGRHGSQGSGDGLMRKDDDMRIWIATLKDYMRSHEQEQVRLMAESLKAGQKPSGESPAEEEQDPRSAPIEPSVHFDQLVVRKQPSKPRLRSPSADTLSFNRPPVSPSLHLISEPQLLGSTRRRRAYTSTTTQPPVSEVGPRLESTSTAITTIQIPDMAEEEVECDQQENEQDAPSAGSGLARETSSASTIKDGKYGPNSHARGSSFTLAQGTSKALSGKKSLPDLRQSHAEIIQHRNSNELTPIRPERDRKSHLYGLGIEAALLQQSSSKPEQPQRSTVSSSDSFPDMQIGTTPLTTHPQTPSDYKKGRMPKHAGARSGSGPGPKPTSRSGSAGITESRDTYFRRLDTLPISTIAASTPASLLHFVDGVRGILFALSQIHSSLRQYTDMVSDDSVTRLFIKPATSLETLINALDRFDAMSRRRVPTPQVIRQLVESCKESIGGFGLVAQNLQMHAKDQTAATDSRFLRTLLIMVYGSLAEIATAWQSIHPYLEDIKQLLNPEAVLRRHAPQPSTTSMGSSLRTPISPIMEGGESIPAFETESQTNTVGGSPNVPEYTARGSPGRHLPLLKEKSKRNAGSFSAEDVQTGMMLGPGETDQPLSSAASTASSFSDQMNQVRQLIFPHSRNPSSLGGIVIPEVDEEDDDEMEGSISFGAYKAGSSSTATAKSESDARMLETLQEASEIAYTVWLRLSEELSDSNSTSSSFSSDSPQFSPRKMRSKTAQRLMENVAKAEGNTRRLTESLMEIGADPTRLQAVLDKPVEEFTTAVWTVNELVNTLSKERVLPPSVRALLSSLVSKTRECDNSSRTAMAARSGGGGSDGGDLAPPPSLRNSAANRPASPAFGYRALEVKAPPITNMLPKSSTSSSFAAFQMPLSAGMRQGMPARSRSANVLPGSAGPTTGVFGNGFSSWDSR